MAKERLEKTKAVLFERLKNKELTEEQINKLLDQILILNGLIEHLEKQKGG